MTGRRERGRTANRTGAAAEETAARYYVAKGAEILARNWRCREGELDIVVLDRGVLAFVEVKQRRHGASLYEPVSPAQWRRLEQAANRYMMEEAAMTGGLSGMRFDLVLIGPGGVPQVIENARNFDDS